MIWKALFGDDGPAPEAEPAPLSFAERMIEQLDRIRWDARRAGAHLPVEALPHVGLIEDVLGPLLDHLVLNPPNIDEELAVEAMLTDYLPTALTTYTNLNPQFAREPRPDGRTPGDDLVDQLVMLEAAARSLSTAIYAHDAQDLQAHGRFLRVKFDRSDLAL